MRWLTMNFERRLTQVLEGLLDSPTDAPLDKSLSGEQQDQLAKKTVGDNGTAATGVKQTIQQKQAADKRADPRQNKDLKTTLQKLSGTSWKPQNPQFRALSAKLLGTIKQP